MKQEILNYKHTTIGYSTEGKGDTLVLIHGYMESSAIWEKVSEELSKNFRIITIDLPGYGKSGQQGEIHSMELMAETVDFVMSKLGTDKFSLIGHSMGGYVVMEYLNLYPEKIQSYCLLHSTPFSDTEAKKKEREKVIKLLEEGKQTILAKKHTEKTFATENIDKFTSSILKLTKIATETPVSGIISSQKGMQIRSDHYSTFMKNSHNSLWILGKLDNFISIEEINKIEIPERCKREIFDKSGHQSYIEEEKKLIETLKNFFL